MNIVKALVMLVFVACALNEVAHAQLQIDAEAVRVHYPAGGEAIEEKTRFKTEAYFRNAGFVEIYDVPIRILIRRCSDNAVVFQADTIMPELYQTDETRVFLPTKQGGTYDVTKISPGCYKVAVIARYNLDENRLNDTAYSTFMIKAKSSVAQRDANDDARLFSVYPNPTRGAMHLEMTDETLREASTLRLYTTDGRLLRTQAATASNTTIDLTGVPRGVYTLELVSASGATLGKQRIVYR